MNSLSSKIGLGYLIIIILNISLAVYAIYHISRMAEPFDKILKENFHNISSAENMKLAFTQQELTQLTMVESKIDSTNISDFNNSEKKFKDGYKQAYNSISLPEEIKILDSLKRAYNTYLLKSDSLQQLIKLNKPYAEYKLYHYNNIVPLATKLNALCEHLKEVNTKAITEADKKAKGISLNARFLISGFAAVTILISIITAIYLTKKIIGPVKETTASIRKIRHGHFNQKISITTNDEIAELGIEFNSMTDRINRYIRDVGGLKELDRLKSDFMAKISHEFKTPLTSINMIIDILHKEIKGHLNDDQKELLTSAKEDVLRLNEFAKNLLDLSRLESGKIAFEINVVKTEDLIEYVLNSFLTVIDEKKIHLITENEIKAEKIHADYKQLSRVLTNLLDNAIRYTNSNGEIKIIVRKQKDNIEFCVADNGPGIAPEFIDLIFEKFVQTENSDHTNVGLGLAISREIVEQHLGKMWVESVREKGSKFYFNIPLKRQNEN